MNQYYLLVLFWASLAMSCTSAWEVSQQSNGTSPDGIPYTNPSAQQAGYQQTDSPAQGNAAPAALPQEAESFFDFVANKPTESSAPAQGFQQPSPSHTQPQSNLIAENAPSNYRQSQLPPKAPVAALAGGDQLIAIDRNLLLEWRQLLDEILAQTGTEQATPAIASRSSSFQQPAPAPTVAPHNPQPSAPVVTASPSTTNSVQAQWDEFEDPNAMLFQEMEQRMKQANPAPSQPQARVRQPAPAPIAQPVAAKPAPIGLIPIQLASGRQVHLNERMLVEWENELIASRRGRRAEVALPTWLLQGLEWLTDAPSVEPERSQVLMPLYRYMKNHNYFDDVNQNSMTPGQIVAKLRVLVEDAKLSNGSFLQGP